MNFNERLRYLIDCEEIKLKDLAPKLCLSASTLSNYTQGIREPDYDTLRRIADYFGVSIDYLLVDDVISTGESIEAIRTLVEKAGGNVVGKVCILTEGDPEKHKGIIRLGNLPLFPVSE